MAQITPGINAIPSWYRAKYPWDWRNPLLVSDADLEAEEGTIALGGGGDGPMRAPYRRPEQVDLDRDNGSPQGASPGANHAAVEDDAHPQHAAAGVETLGIPRIEHVVAVAIRDEVFVERRQQERRGRSGLRDGLFGMPIGATVDDAGGERGPDRFETRARIGRTESRPPLEVVDKLADIVDAQRPDALDAGDLDLLGGEPAEGGVGEIGRRCIGASTSRASGPASTSTPKSSVTSLTATRSSGCDPPAQLIEIVELGRRGREHIELIVGQAA